MGLNSQPIRLGFQWLWYDPVTDRLIAGSPLMSSGILLGAARGRDSIQSLPGIFGRIGVLPPSHLTHLSLDPASGFDPAAMSTVPSQAPNDSSQQPLASK